MEQIQGTYKIEKWKFIAYPINAVVAVFSFLFVFFQLLPIINDIGLVAFSTDERVLFNYYVLPFTCIDMSIVLGYYKLLRRFATWVCKTLKNRKSGKDSK